jgi:hypothetical protein
VASVEGALVDHEGRREPLTTASLLRGPEGALRALTLAVTALGAALVVLRLG